MEVIQTNQAPAAIGPYSQAIVCNGFLFASGQIPLDPATGAVAGTTITEQAAQVMKNCEAILAVKGKTFADVVKTTCFLADMKDFGDFNKVYEPAFISKPARSCFAVKELPKGVLCEVEFIAVM